MNKEKTISKPTQEPLSCADCGAATVNMIDHETYVLCDSCESERVDAADVYEGISNPDCSARGHDWNSREEAYENNRPLLCARCGTCGDV